MYNGGKIDRNDTHSLAVTIKGECAPTVQGQVCSDRESIARLRDALKITASAPDAVVIEAKKKTGCESESCTLKKAGVFSGAVVERFRPEGPWKSTTWLNNENIDQVLEQYAQKYPKFKHVEFQMRDFASQGGELAKLDWTQLAKDYDSLGCVLNTDLSSGSGEHWTPIYIDFRGCTVEYFDSAGPGTPPREFSEFVIRTAHLLSQCGKKFRDCLLTNVEHQLKNTECGVYSLYYILARLHGISCRAFENNRIPDSMMTEFRASLFRNS